MELITTIKFKSSEDNYRKEASGLKRNTVRIFNPDTSKGCKEIKEIEANRLYITVIRIVCTKGIHFFDRTITDITRIERGRVIIYIFSW